MFQLPPIPDVAARLNQMRQSATLAPIQQAQQQRGQVFQPSLPRGGGNEFAQGAAGLSEGLKTVAAVLKERQEEEKAKGFVDNFFNQFDPQSQTMPASFPDGPTGESANDQILNADKSVKNPFFTEAGWQTARAMKDAGQYVPLMGILQTRMMQPPKGPEILKAGEGDIFFEHRPDGTTVKIAEGPAKKEARTAYSDIGKINLDAENGIITSDAADAAIRALRQGSALLTPEETAKANFPAGSVVQRGGDGKLSVLYTPPKTGEGSGFKDANVLRDEFIKGSGDYVKVRDAYARIRSAGKDPSAAGDMALIFSFMKVLDPGSTVREGEYASAQQAAGVPDRILSMYNRVVAGERLAPVQRQDFMDRSKSLYQAQRKSYDAHVSEYTRLSKLFNIDPAGVLVDFGSGEGVNDEKQAGAGGVAPPPPAADLPAGSIEAMSLSDLTQLDRNSMSNADLQRLIARARQLKASGGGN